MARGGSQEEYIEQYIQTMEKKHHGKRYEEDLDFKFNVNRWMTAAELDRFNIDEYDRDLV